MIARMRTHQQFAAPSLASLAIWIGHGYVHGSQQPRVDAMSAVLPDVRADNPLQHHISRASGDNEAG